MRCIFPHTCRVVAYTPYRDGGVIRFSPHVLYEDLPCTVSVRRAPAGAAVDGAVTVGQTVRLYTPARATVPAGCTVEYRGRVYRRSGEGVRYPTHSEYDLVLEENA